MLESTELQRKISCHIVDTLTITKAQNSNIMRERDVRNGVNINNSKRERMTGLSLPSPKTNYASIRYTSQPTVLLTLAELKAVSYQRTQTH